jgi:DNA-binding NarL/FixJ family response regulator
MSRTSGSSGPSLSSREAEQIVRRFGADPSSGARTGAAVERFFAQLQKRFNPLVGQSGYRALLQAAHRKVVKEHPVLERCPVEPEGNPFFGGLESRMGDADPAEVWGGLTALTGEFIRLANNMGRGEEAIRTGLESPGQGGPSGGGRSAAAVPDVSGPVPASGDAPVGQHGPPVSGGSEAHRPKRSSQVWRILVMDRDQMTCEALAQALGQAKDFNVIEFGTTAAEVQEKVRVEDIDFVVASAHLPSDEVLEVCRWLRREFTGEFPHVVVTGLPADEAVMLRFLEAGAVAFTMEEFSVEGLRLVLRLTGRGESVFPLRLQHLMSLRLSELAELVRDRGLNPDTLSTLTSREGEVLLRLEEGLTNRQIAKRLFISEGTVKSHVHQILKKLKVRDRNEAVRLLLLQRAAPGELVLTKTGFRRETAPTAKP